MSRWLIWPQRGSMLRDLREHIWKRKNCETIARVKYVKNNKTCESFMKSFFPFVSEQSHKSIIFSFGALLYVTIHALWIPNWLCANYSPTLERKNKQIHLIFGYPLPILLFPYWWVFQGSEDVKMHNWAAFEKWTDWNLLFLAINLWGQPRQLLVMKLDGFEFCRSQGCNWVLSTENTEYWVLSQGCNCIHCHSNANSRILLISDCLTTLTSLLMSVLLCNFETSTH